MSKICLLLLCLFMTDIAWCQVQVVLSKWMIDVETGSVLEGPAIVIQDSKIVQVGSSASLKIPEGAPVIDLGNLFLLPGLIDAHVHLAWGQPGQGGLVGAEDAQKTLMAGFTTVRNPGSTGKADLLLRDAIETGKATGPRMFVSGPALGAKQGVCDRVFNGEAVVSSAEDATRIVIDLAQQKVDLIKFCAGGGVIPSDQDISAKELDDSIIQAIVSETHKHHLKVSAHAQGPAAILQAAAAGVDSIEHGGLINEEAIALMKKNKTYLVPTLYRLDWTLENAEKTGAKEEILQRLRSGRATVHENMRKAIGSGILIAFGTDATVYPHGLNAREFSVLVQLGMTPLKAVQAATLEASNLLGWPDRIGRIKPGYYADLIATSANPLQDIKTLERVQFVMKGGKVYLKLTPDHAP